MAAILQTSFHQITQPRIENRQRTDTILNGSSITFNWSSSSLTTTEVNIRLANLGRLRAFSTLLICLEQHEHKLANTSLRHPTLGSRHSSDIRKSYISPFLSFLHHLLSVRHNHKHAFWIHSQAKPSSSTQNRAETDPTFSGRQSIRRSHARPGQDR